VVWLAMNIQNTASRFQLTFATLHTALDPSTGNAQARAQVLKDLLTGRGGLVSSAEEMRNQTAALLRKLGAFEGRISSANEQLSRYTSQESVLLARANQEVGRLKADIDAFTKQSEEALKKWRDYTIAAVVSSVSLFLIGCLISFLVPVIGDLIGAGLEWGGIAAAAALGAMAAGQRKLYDELRGKIASSEIEKSKKSSLVTDLTSMNLQMEKVQPGLSDFKKNLEIIEGIWVDLGGMLSFICSNYQPAQLADFSWVNQTFQVLDAQAKWGQMATVTEEFTQNSLVEYRHGKFGDPMPAQAAA
jgi:hypothetical protein